MSDETWENVYRRVVLETDHKNIPNRIAEVRRAIERALLSIDDPAKQSAIQEKLKSLTLLETETRDRKREA